MNNVSLIGRLTKEVDTRYTATTNTCMGNFTLAVNRRFKKEGQPDADFINIVTIGKTAEFVSQYFKKGMQVGVVGRIQTRTWDDDQGMKHYVTEIVAEQVFFADSKKDGATQDATQSDSQPWTPTQASTPFDANSIPSIPASDDLPF